MDWLNFIVGKGPPQPSPHAQVSMPWRACTPCALFSVRFCVRGVFCWLHCAALFKTALLRAMTDAQCRHSKVQMCSPGHDMLQLARTGSRKAVAIGIAGGGVKKQRKASGGQSQFPSGTSWGGGSTSRLQGRGLQLLAAQPTPEVQVRFTHMLRATGCICHVSQPALPACIHACLPGHDRMPCVVHSRRWSVRLGIIDFLCTC